MVDKEVVQFIGTHQILRLLLDGAISLDRNQFGADRCIYNVEQDAAHLSIVVMLSLPLHQVAHEGLGDTRIHAIHRHMVTIVGSPSECQLREVARTDYDSILTIGHIHKQLCTLARLAILIGSIVHINIVLNILKVLYASILNTNLTQRHTQMVHQVKRILVGTVRSSESRHGNTDDTRTGKLQTVEGTHRSQQCQRRI